MEIIANASNTVDANNANTMALVPSDLNVFLSLKEKIQSTFHDEEEEEWCNKPPKNISF